MWIVSFLIAPLRFCLVACSRMCPPHVDGDYRGDVVRAAALLFAMAWTAIAGSARPGGETLFKQCEFKAAARVFEHALIREPGSARLHFWLGKSYARLAEVSSPLSAPRNARRARAHLEAAVQLDPHNREFLMELFEFYADSPTWFDRGLCRATALLERFGPDDGGPGTPSRILAESRKEYSGPEWAFRKGILRLSAAPGYSVPLR